MGSERKKFGKALLFVVIFMTVAFGSIGCASAATIYVPDNYTKVQWAIDNATAGETIIVRDGTYYENVVVDKQLNLTGIGMPVVDAGGNGTAITVSADGCVIDGFYVTGSGWKWESDAGIKVTSNNNVIINNTASSNNWGGIRLDYSSNCTLTGNIMSNNPHNFVIRGWQLSHYTHSIDQSNTVDGKPIYYLIDEANIEINSTSNAGYVALINSSNIIVRDLLLKNNHKGILLVYTNNSRIENATAMNNDHGISLLSSYNCTLSNNKVTSNNWVGIELDDSFNCTLINNMMSNNAHNFDVSGYSLSHYIHDIDTTNTVDSKPISYWANEHDKEIPGDAGYVGVVNSTNITVKNLTLSANMQGVLFAYTNNSKIENVNASNNLRGICLWFSNHNVISNNNASKNYSHSWWGSGIYSYESNSNTVTDNTLNANGNGILLYNSRNNTITRNTANRNGDRGILLDNTSDTTISDNNASFNRRGGILLEESWNNLIVNNVASNNSEFGIDISHHSQFHYSHDNQIYNNTANGNGIGINLYESYNNIITNNNANLNNVSGISLDNSSNNTITDNTENSNKEGGIWLHSSSNNIITSNTANSNNGTGMGIYSSDYNTLSDNVVTFNRGDGIYIEGSEENNLTTNDALSNMECGISLNRVSYNNIISNNVSNNTYSGINLWESYNNIVTNNTANLNKEGGIFLQDSSNYNTLIGNTASNNRYGIYLDSSSNNTIIGNIANSNTKAHGVWLWESCNNTVTNNTAYLNNESGICLDYSNNNTITRNTAYLNNHSGIQLNFGSSYNTFTNNTVNNNSASGIHLEDSSNYNTITDNTAKENSPCGIWLGNSRNNLIYNNYFDNANNAYDDGNNIWNISKIEGTNIIGGPYLGGNYWSDYDGDDSDGDGLGDTLLPYKSSGNIQNGGDWLPLVIPHASISGRVCEVDGVTPIAGATVEAIPVENGKWMKTKTASDGNYLITDLPTGKYKVRAFKSGYAREYYDNVFPSHVATIISIITPNEISGINFNLTRGGSISGYVYNNETGEPIEGAQINVVPSSEWSDDGFYTITDSNGSYTIECLALGAYRVRTKATGFIEQWYDNAYSTDFATDVKVTPPDNTPNINFSLSRGGSISGYVFDTNGNPIQGAHVRAGALLPNGDWVAGRTSTQLNGSYIINDLLAWNYYKVLVRKAGFAPEWYNSKITETTADTVTVTVGNNTPGINFTLDVGGSITGHVYDEEDGTPISGIGVWVDLPTGERVGVSGLTEYDGSYTIWLCTGNYLIETDVSSRGNKYVPEWYNNSYDVENATLVNVIAPTETSGIDFYLAKAGSISGYVYSEEGEPIGDANVYAFSDIYPGSGANTQSDGSYRIEGLPSGNYIVQVTVSGYVSEYYDNVTDPELATEVIVSAPDDTPSINFILKKIEEYKGFDTGAGTYPSIMGTHKGEITPLANISVSKLYTSSCVGTGGHTESIKLYENDTLIANGTWNGYQSDWHNITIHNVTGAPYITLLKDHEYNYIIRTGSYPQIIHANSKDVTGGTITCTSFVDANGKTYTDWIPAIRLE